jgi:hypothetical protein
MLLVALWIEMTNPAEMLSKKYELANWFKTLFRPSITQKSPLSFLVVVKTMLTLLLWIL